MTKFKENGKYKLLSQSFDENINYLNIITKQLSKNWLIKLLVSKQISNINSVKYNLTVIQSKCLYILGKSIEQEQIISNLRKTLAQKDATIANLTTHKRELETENKKLRNALNELKETVVNMEDVIGGLTTTVKAYIKADTEEVNVNAVPKNPVKQEKSSAASTKGRPKKKS